VDALRKAFAEIIRDPAFVAETAKAKLSVSYASGEQLQTMIGQAMQTLDEKAIAEVREIALDRYYSN
jgi:tripartite-type tricarboxylate transporter receptor subunit TctC